MTAAAPSGSSDLARWLAALAAPIRVRLHATTDDLGAGHRPRGRKGDRYCQDQLRGVASIASRADLLEQLPIYLDGGARGQYAMYRRWLDELPREWTAVGFYLVEDAVRRWRTFVFDHAGRPEEHDVAAWDCARVVHYVGLGWAAGYLAEHEAWGYALRAARLAQAAYGSWADYGRGFAYGRWFWQGWWDDGMQATQAAIDGLLADPDGPWALPWAIDLAPAEAWTRDPVVRDAAAPAMVSTAVRAQIDCAACLVPMLVVRADGAARCLACGLASEEAARSAWQSVAPRVDDDDGDDDDDEDVDDEELDDDDDDDELDGEAHDDEVLDRDDGENLAGAPDQGVDDPAADPVEPDDDPGPMINLENSIVRAAIRRDVRPACRACGAAIDDDAIRAGADAGAHACTCGASIAIVRAAPWLRELSPRLRYVVGGPLAVGRPHEYLYLLADGDPT